MEEEKYMFWFWHRSIKHKKKTKVADVDFSKHFLWFLLQHQMENGTIDHIFKTYLVRGDEEATVQNSLEKATLI